MTNQERRMAAYAEEGEAFWERYAQHLSRAFGISLPAARAMADQVRAASADLIANGSCTLYGQTIEWGFSNE